MDKIECFRQLADMIDMGVIDVDCSDKEERASWYLVINEIFVDTADTEDIAFEDIEDICKAWKKSHWTDVVRWVAKKRGVKSPY